MTFDAKRYRRERQDRLAAERLDTLEPPPPRKGCNLVLDGKRCRRRVAVRIPGYFGMFRVCSEHKRLVEEHSRILHRILAIPPR
jgi:hypothetical protein